MRVRVGLSLVVLLGFFGSTSCGSETPKATLAVSCTYNSDCASALVCALGRCHEICQTSKDCPDGERCIGTGQGIACQLADETSCSAKNPCSEPLTCGSDGQCRNRCSRTSDCIGGQQCTAELVCADVNEIDPNNNLKKGDAGAGGATGDGGAPNSGGNGGASGSSTDAGSGGASAGGAQALDSGTDTTRDSGPPPCDPTLRPDDDTGLFVAPAPAGADSNTGARQAPLATLAAAVALAKTSGRTFLYLAPGAYQESLTLSGLGAGLTIEGGFIVSGNKWTKDCSDTAREETVVIAPNTTPESQPTLTFSGAIGSTVLRTLSIKTKLAPAVTAEGADGESLVGLFVDATAKGSLALDDVWVQASHGGDGGVGAPAPSTEAPSCNQTTGGDGATGASGVAGVEPDRGLFTVNGYANARGGDGAPGTAGDDGTKSTGSTGTCSQSCGGAYPVCLSSGTSPYDTRGKNGCGGPGGLASGPGGGGGASVAVYVVGSSATVSISGSRLEAASGGNGADAGSPGTGASGTSGVAGTAVNNCITSCSTVNPCNSGAVVQSFPAGTAGDGGKGGDGAPGGSGAGGPSYSLVVLGPPSRVTTTGSDLEFQSGGTDPSSKVAASAARFDAPSCGNGALDSGEQCDDGNRIDGDGCGNDCKVHCGGAGETLYPETGACFALTTASRSFDQARAECQHRGPGWDLATFGTAVAAKFVADRLGVGSRNYGWAGATKDASGTFVSVNARPLPGTPFPWAAGEPNGGQTETCLEILSNGQFNDGACSVVTQALCERDVPNFQLEGCGDGKLGVLEECDDANTNEADGCTSRCTIECPAGTVDLATRTCLLALPTGLDTKAWSDARTACQGTGAGWDLLVPKNMSEIAAAFALNTSGGSAWFGATDDGTLVTGATGTDWKWVDGTDVDLTTWKFPTTASSCASWSGVTAASGCAGNGKHAALCQFRIP